VGVLKRQVMKVGGGWWRLVEVAVDGVTSTNLQNLHRPPPT